MPGARFPPYTMWGHPSLLLRDIAVNESDQERVSDSGAIRSGLVPQLKHNAIQALPPPGEPLGDVPRLWPRHPVSGECAIGRAQGRRMCQRARKTSGSWCWLVHTAECHVMRLPEPNDLRCDWSSVTLHRLRRFLATLLRLPPCGPPLSVHRRSIAWSFSHDVIQPDHADGRVRADGTRQSLLEPSLRNGRLPDLVEAGILCPARCTRGSRRCLNGWL